MPNLVAMARKTLKIKLSDKLGSVSAIWLEPTKTERALVFTHGAGAGMDHMFMETVANNLAAEGIATLRFNFRYIEIGKRSPDTKAVLTETIRQAIAKARTLTKKPLMLGGKSLGGRMASWVVAEGVDGVSGLVFFGFPLHAPGKISTDRAEHLKDVRVPMLFLQGTRDSLADLMSIKEVCAGLRRRATLEIIDGGDHSFKVPAKMKVSYEDVLDDLAKRVRKWSAKIS